jgi:hypothetical protein
MSDLSKLFRSFQTSAKSAFSYFMERVERETFTTNKLDGPFVGIVLSDPKAVDTVVSSTDGLNQYVPIYVRLYKTDDLKIPDPFLVLEGMKSEPLDKQADKFLKVISLHQIARPSVELVTQDVSPIFGAGCIVECQYEDLSPVNGGRERGLVYTKVLSNTNLFDSVDLDIQEVLSDAFNFTAPTLLNDFSKGQSAIYQGSAAQFKGKTVYNGNLPSQLIATSTDGTAVLKDIVEDLNQLEAAYKAKFNKPMSASGNRSFQTQVELKESWTAKGKPSYAATPGTSNHGWAKAIDISVLFPSANGPYADADAAFASGEYKWLARKASRYNFSNPAWARTGGPIEPWHWEHNTNVITNINKPKK